jgi:hypothetical protein
MGLLKPDRRADVSYGSVGLAGWWSSWKCDHPKFYLILKRLVGKEFVTIASKNVRQISAKIREIQDRPPLGEYPGVTITIYHSGLNP